MATVVFHIFRNGEGSYGNATAMTDNVYLIELDADDSFTTLMSGIVVPSFQHKSIFFSLCRHLAMGLLVYLFT